MADPVSQTSLAALSPRQRAQVILSAARADMAGKLWQAALGTASESKDIGSLPGPQLPAIQGQNGALAMILGDILPGSVQSVPQPVAPTAAPVPEAPAISEPAETAPVTAGPLRGLGANKQHEAALNAASRRTGIPAAALASIIDAEAARLPDGGWNPHSRNPRSSAAGLGQFLSGTWLHMARQNGTALNHIARERGLVTAQGQIAPGARPALLALRNDAGISIHAVADYAKGNIDHLRSRGLDIGKDAQSMARASYISHHLGPGDAVRYYQGTIPQHRARLLLAAQIGASGAGQRIEAAGNATSAHRQWLSAYVSRNIRPERYAAAPQWASLPPSRKEDL